MTVYVLINEAQSAPLAASVTSGWLALVAACCTKQLAQDFCPAWQGSAIGGVRAGDAASLQPGERAFVIRDTLPEAPNAVAYHDVDGNGLPTAFLALATCATLDDVSTAVAHEVLETAADPDCNLWADAGTGFEYAREACDAVQAGKYAIDGVAVSDFVLPAFFDPGAAGPYNHLNTVRAPFATDPGGYQIVRNAGTGETQVTGEMPPHKRDAAMAGHGRSAQRLLGRK